MKNICLSFVFSVICLVCAAQTDTAKTNAPDSIRPVEVVDTALRIINLNPLFSVHVDSTLSYQFQVNKASTNYFWFIKNAPLGVRINKDNGLLYFKADKPYFLSGRLKYDYNYTVTVGVQNLLNPKERTDSVFTIVFFNTEIIPSKIKPTVNGTVWIEEGDTLRFKVLCETGNFPIESILTQTSIPIGDFTPVQACNGEFKWSPTYEFVKDTDTGKIKSVIVSFIGSTKFKMVDTAQLKIVVKNGLNYPLALEQYHMLVHDMSSYIMKLKFTFLQLDKSIKRTKGTRTGFDLTAASAALSGTVLSTSKDEQTKRTGLIMPSVGVILSPIKEATAPSKTAEQNQATLLRSSIKRLEYVLQDNALVGEKDISLAQKSAKIKEELRQSQMQLIDVPIEITNNMTEEELNQYFNSRKVMKKYNLKNK